LRPASYIAEALPQKTKTKTNKKIKTEEGGGGGGGEESSNRLGTALLILQGRV
jgi:hypothetical protein